MNRCLASVVLVLSLPLGLRADEPAKSATVVSPAKSMLSITLDGRKLEYDAKAEMTSLRDDEGKVQASIFSISYTKTGADPATRPITFCFNGGPGSSSVWLHMGAFGPKRVALTDTGESLPPPASLVENESSILDLTDLVFIDPVSTGFSRATEEKNAKNYHGVTEDIASVGEFIRLTVTKRGRWASPKYLAGESYGTTRAAGLAGLLQSKLGMRMNGIVLVSAVLNFGTIRFDEGNDAPYPLFLPSYAATAWYHKKLEPTLQADLKKTLAEVEAFATGEYTVALLKGLALSESERKEVAAKLARYTGLSDEYVLRSDLRIEGARFMRELLRDRGQIVGRYDSRYLGRDGNAAAERPDFDPSYTAVQGPFTEAFNNYVRKDLKYETDLPYEILTSRVQPWNYATASNRYLNVVPTLRTAMATNADLRVFVANGYYDLATPYAATQSTFNHLGPDRKLLERVKMTYYEAGHMMYALKPAREKLRKDLVAFWQPIPK